MEITLTLAQYHELHILSDAVNKLQNSGSASGEVVIDSTKVEYGAVEVKFTIND